MPPVPPPFYQDWTFWSFVAAAIAITLSQLPPVRVLFKRGRLEVDVHSHVSLGHEAGHTNVQLLVGLRNIGGREVRVRRLWVELRRGAEVAARLPVRVYFEKKADQISLLFLPFTLAQGTERWHNYWFFPVLDNTEDRTLRQLQADVVADIRTKVEERKQNDPDARELLQVDWDLEAALTHYVQQRFKLMAGEYEMDLGIETTEVQSSQVRTYRFTLFESDVAELQAFADDYKFGFGMGLERRKPAWVSRQLTPK